MARPEPRSFGPIALPVLFATALAVRAVHIFQMRESPFFAERIGDALTYHRWATRIEAGDWIGSEVFYQAPLYPYSLAAIYAFGSNDILTVRLVQIVLGSASCVLLALAGRNFFSARVGLLAGAFMAFYAPAVFFDALLQKSVLDLFFVCLLLWLLSKGIRQTTPAQLAWVGATCGLLILTRENASVFAVPIALWAALPGRGPLRHRVALFAAFGIGVAIVLAPVAARNAWVGDEFVVTTSQLGPNLYIGNHPGARGVYQPLVPRRGSPRFERSDATRLAERETGRRLSPAEVSRYWLGRAIEYARTQPVEWSALMLRKLALLVNASEVPDTEDQYVFARWSAPLRWAGPVSHFGVLVPLALFGVWASRADWRRLALLLALPATYAASVVVFYVMARYRLPLVPFLLLFGALGLCEAPRIWHTMGRAQLATLAAVVGVVSAFCNYEILGYVPRLALAHYNLGSRFETLGRLDDASAQFRIALEHAELSQAHDHLGMILRSQGKLEEAVAHHRNSLGIDPGSAPTHAALAAALNDMGERQRAKYHYRRSLALDPSSAEVHYQLVKVLLDEGDLEGAAREFTKALAAKPELADSLRRLGGVEIDERRNREE